MMFDFNSIKALGSDKPGNYFGAVNYLIYLQFKTIYLLYYVPYFFVVACNVFFLNLPAKIVIKAVVPNKFKRFYAISKNCHKFAKLQIYEWQISFCELVT